MSEPSPTWNKMCDRAVEAQKAFDYFSQSVLGELIAAENRHTRMAQTILSWIERTRRENELESLPYPELDKPSSNSFDRLSVLVADIEALCRKRVGGEQEARDGMA